MSAPLTIATLARVLPRCIAELVCTFRIPKVQNGPDSFYDMCRAGLYEACVGLWGIGALCGAARCGSFELYKIIRPTVNRSDYRSSRNGLLMEAARGGDLSIVQHIAKALQKSRLWIDDCMHAACRGGHLSIAQYLIERGATDWTAYLPVACRGGNSQVVKLLLDKGADAYIIREGIRSFDAVYWAYRNGNPVVIQLIVRKITTYSFADIKWCTYVVGTMLAGACDGGHIDSAARLIPHIRDICLYMNMTRPIRKGWLPIVDLILVNYLPFLTDHLDTNMDAAIKYDQPAIVDRLIQAGACNWDSYLEGAITHNRIDLARLFIAREANLRSRNDPMP